MDKKYLTENNLMEAHKQFMRLCELTYTGPLEEEEPQDQDMQAPQDGGQGMPPMDGGQDPSGAMGGDMPMDGEQQDPNAMGGDMPPMDDGQGMPPMDGGQDPSGAMGGDMPMEDPMMGGDMPMGEEEQEDVIDVDDITNAQEKMNDKINIVGKDLGKADDKLEALNATIDKLMSLIDQNNNQIEDLRQEFEKRNPTQTEKLNMRSLDSYPFNVNPKDYWKEKGIDSNYDVRSDNSEPTNSEKELTITNSDVDDFDERTIENSFDITDDMEQTLQKIFGL